MYTVNYHWHHNHYHYHHYHPLQSINPSINNYQSIHPSINQSIQSTNQSIHHTCIAACAHNSIGLEPQINIIESEVSEDLLAYPHHLSEASCTTSSYASSPSSYSSYSSYSSLFSSSYSSSYSSS